MAYEIPGAVNLSLGELYDHLDELDPAKSYIVLCAIGVRAYNAARILMQNGFGHVKIYPGGIRFYEANHPDVSKNKQAAENIPDRQSDSTDDLLHAAGAETDIR